MYAYNVRNVYLAFILLYLISNLSEKQQNALEMCRNLIVMLSCRKDLI